MPSFADTRVTAFPSRAAVVTPSDDSANNFDDPSSVYVGGDGNVAVIPWNSTTAVTFVGLIAGQVVPVRVRRVNATNTTASNLVRVY